MRYTFEPGESSPYMVSLRPEEAKVLAKLLAKVHRDLQKKVEKYRDILEGGEATERQQTILFEAADQLGVVERFIILSDEDFIGFVLNAKFSGVPLNDSHNFIFVYRPSVFQHYARVPLRHFSEINISPRKAYLIIVCAHCPSSFLSSICPNTTRSSISSVKLNIDGIALM